MRDLMSRLKEGLGTATETAKRKAAEAKQIVDRKLNENLFQGIIAGCVLIMNTSMENKSVQDRSKEEHKLLISLAEKGITNYFTQEEITASLAKYMSIFESGNFLAGYGFCVAAIAQVKKESDISLLIRFMYDVSAADGFSDPEEQQLIVDVAGFLGFKNYAVVEPQLTGYVPFKMSDAQRQISAPPTTAPGAPSTPPPQAPPAPQASPEAETKPADDGIPDWMRK
jgi:tellurite resistance protein